MKSRLGRRDFLKLAGLLPLGLALPSYLRMYRPSLPAAGGKKNVLVILFDAFSAYHLPIYGYGRETTPNITRLAERAIVYHNHYAGSNFTTPGTASLLTGTLPWTHRAFEIGGKVTASVVPKNLFQAFEHYYRIAYSHNPLVNTLFNQFAANLDEYVPMNRLFLTADAAVHTLFATDEDIADVAWTQAVKKDTHGYSYSLFLSDIYQGYIHDKIAAVAALFPRGLPSTRDDSYFRLEDAIDWLQTRIQKLPQPYFGYFHFLPPHEPTNTRIDFYGAFAKDHFEPPPKPTDLFATSRLLAPDMLRQRSRYDEFILYLDHEFGRLFDYLDSSGVLDNTYVVLTSDHGELFERGVRGHSTPLLYQPVVRVPLMIFEPGRTNRTDIRSLTSAVDLLPTLLSLGGENPVDWAEGTILPPFAPTDPDPNRVVYALYARKNDPRFALTHATAMLAAGTYKLTYFFGYPELGHGVERVELYDVTSDPEELHDLYSARSDIGAPMLAALKAKIKEVNQPYL